MMLENEALAFGETEGDFSAVDKARVVEALGKVLPPGTLMYDAEDLRPYECDGLAAYRALPLVVALPTTEEQVVAVLRICHELGVPVVARGAGTGLSGGALPHTRGVLLSLARFNRILKLDPLARTAVVQPGVRNLAISEAAAPYGLYYAPDPSSQIACSIGGNVAENAGGVHCLKYGLTVHNLLRVRGVTIEGEIVEIGSGALDSPGYDLLALVTGSEGMLVVLTEVTVKLVPKPQLAQCVLAAFDDVVRAGEAVAKIIAAGIIPAGLEMMDQPATRRSRSSCAPAIRSMPRRSCCASPTARRRRWPRRSPACARCWRKAAPPRSASRATRPSGCASGPGARPPSRRPGGSRPTTTAWTAPSRASASARCSPRSRTWKASTACAA
jgi:glycolate oxidase